MRLRNVRFSQFHLASQFGVERSPQQRQRPEPFDPAQSRLNVQEGRGEPALFLIRGAPAIDFISALPEERIERLEAVGGLQAYAELGEQSQAVQRERLLEPLVETLNRRLEIGRA